MCRPVIVSVATQVDASCDELYKVIADIESKPLVVTPVVSIKRISEGRSFEVGTRWEEIRLYKGEQVTQLKTVTSLRKEGGGYSLLINVSYPGVSSSIINTSTLEIRPLSGERNKCVLIGSYGVMPGNFSSTIFFCLRARRIAKAGEITYLVELDEIGNAAASQSRTKATLESM